MSAIWTTLRRALALLMGFAVGTTVVSAWALSQNGLESTNTNVSGSTISIVGDSFSAPSGECVLYSHLVSSPSKHVEAGQLRCNGATIDGTCLNDHLFIERYTGSNYYCVQGVTFNNGQGMVSTIRRYPGLSSTSMKGMVAGAELTQSGFLIGASTVATAWGESTGGCPTGAARGRFRNWKKLGSGGLWKDVAARAYTNGYICWGVGPISGGDFDVQR